MKQAYWTPIRIVKLKVDNTHDYKIPPEMLEHFLRLMLESVEGQKLLKQMKWDYWIEGP